MRSKGSLKGRDKREELSSPFPPSDRIPPMDIDLHGGRDCLLVRLLDGSPHIRDREMIKNHWRFPRSILESRLDGIRKVDEEIEVLAKAQVLAPESRENLETKIIRREAAKDECKVVFLKGIVFNKIKEIEGLEKNERELNFEVEEEKVFRRKTEDDAKSRVAFFMDVLTRKANDDKLNIESLRKQLAEKSMMANVLERRLREKNSEMARKLREDLLMELTRKKTEADNEAHRLECDALRLQLKRREDCIPKKNKKKKNSTPVISDEAMWECVRKAVEKAELSARMKSVEKTSVAASGRSENSNSMKMKSKKEPEHGGDVVQTEMDLDLEQVQGNRCRVGVQNEASKNLVKQQGSMKTACSTQERKKEKAKRKNKKRV